MYAARASRVFVRLSLKAPRRERAREETNGNKPKDLLTLGKPRETISPVKLPLALLVAVTVLGGAFFISRAVESNRQNTVRKEAARGAETAGMRGVSDPWRVRDAGRTRVEEEFSDAINWDRLEAAIDAAGGKE